MRKTIMAAVATAALIGLSGCVDWHRGHYRRHEEWTPVGTGHYSGYRGSRQPYRSGSFQNPTCPQYHRIR